MPENRALSPPNANRSKAVARPTARSVSRTAKTCSSKVSTVDPHWPVCWPIDLIGGQRNRLKSPKLAVDLKVSRTVLNTERLLKDEAPGSPQTQQTSSTTRHD